MRWLKWCQFYYLTLPKAGGPRSRYQPVWFFSEASLSLAWRWLPSCCVLIWLFLLCASVSTSLLKRTRITLDHGPPKRPDFHRMTPLKTWSPNSVFGGVRTSTYKCGGGGRDTLAHNMVWGHKDQSPVLTVVSRFLRWRDPFAQAICTIRMEPKVTSLWDT